MDLLDITTKIARHLKPLAIEDKRRVLTWAGEAIERDAAYGNNVIAGSPANGAEAPAAPAN
jgi:hypothetical protein